MVSVHHHIMSYLECPKAPVLFLIFINDITEHIDSQICLVVDDCLMYRIIHSPEDHTILQKDLTLLKNWAKKW